MVSLHNILSWKRVVSIISIFLFCLHCLQFIQIRSELHTVSRLPPLGLPLQVQGFKTVLSRCVLRSPTMDVTPGTTSVLPVLWLIHTPSSVPSDKPYYANSFYTPSSAAISFPLGLPSDDVRTVEQISICDRYSCCQGRYCNYWWILNNSC